MEDPEQIRTLDGGARADTPPVAGPEQGDRNGAAGASAPNADPEVSASESGAAEVSAAEAGLGAAEPEVPEAGGPGRGSEPTEGAVGETEAPSTAEADWAVLGEQPSVEAEAFEAVGLPESGQAAAGQEVEAEEAELAEEGEQEQQEQEEREQEEEPEEAYRPSPYDRPGRWYVVHTYSGYENKVSSNLRNVVASRGMEDQVFEVVIPMEDVVEFKGGKKVTVQKKVFPGYLLVRCDLSDDTWGAIRNTPGVTGFVGPGTKPTPLSRREVESILQVKPESGEAPPKRSRPRLAFDLNETVRVREGPFADFSGQIAEINEDQLKLKVLVNIFGRETPVELEFSQVAKL
jgi:transcription termination/antitermination protein NusG